MSDEPSNSLNWNRAKDILTILVIPLLLWCVRQEIRMAKVESVAEDVAELRSDLHDLEIKVAAMQGPVQSNTSDVASLQARLDHLTILIKKIDQNLSEESP